MKKNKDKIKGHIKHNEQNKTYKARQIEREKEREKERERELSVGVGECGCGCVGVCLYEVDKVGEKEDSSFSSE